LSKSRTARNAKLRNREKFGVRIPNNTRQALLFDKENKNNKWGDAIAKEMSALDKLNCFRYHGPGKKFAKKEGWQYASVHMIYDIKQADLRHKARLVVGGHMIDSTMHTTYSSNVHNMSVRLMMLISVKMGLDLGACDIGNAFPTAPCTEKVWTQAGPEFGDKQGCTVEIIRALYGLATASRSFHEMLCDLLRRMGFRSSRADPDLWYKKSDDHSGYDYIATHVDDVIIAAKRPMDYMALIEQEFVLRNMEDSPEYYLGNDIKKIMGKYMHVYSTKYLTETVRKYQTDHGDLRKETSPMTRDSHLELVESGLLDPDGIRHYQNIMGILQWLATAGRFDIHYAVCSLSIFQVAPRERHLKLNKKVLCYLKKFPKRGYVVNPKPSKFEMDMNKVKLARDFSNQYQYFTEDMDPRFPDPLYQNSK
jgi:hypothetical protein